MPRVKRGPKRAAKRKKVLKLSSGYFGVKSNAYRMAKQQVDKSLAYAYRDRRQRKREMRRLWIVRINAAARLIGVSYSKLMGALGKAGIDLDRKSLATLATTDPTAFKAVAAQAKAVA
jgi:large subunit ribosomal protein L20